MKKFICFIWLMLFAVSAWPLTDVEYNKAFSQLNNIPYGAKNNQAADREYFKTLIKNNRAIGGNFYKDPDDMAVVKVPVVPVISPVCTGTSTALSAARETVRQLEMLR